MPTDRFAEQQLIDCLERLSPEARERLGWKQTDLGWELDGCWIDTGPEWHLRYSDHAAVLAEVEGASFVNRVAESSSKVIKEVCEEIDD